MDCARAVEWKTGEEVDRGRGYVMCGPCGVPLEVFCGGDCCSR